MSTRNTVQEIEQQNADKNRAETFAEILTFAKKNFRVINDKMAALNCDKNGVEFSAHGCFVWIANKEKFYVLNKSIDMKIEITKRVPEVFASVRNIEAEEILAVMEYLANELFDQPGKDQEPVQIEIGFVWRKGGALKVLLYDSEALVLYSHVKTANGFIKMHKEIDVDSAAMQLLKDGGNGNTLSIQKLGIAASEWAKKVGV